MSSPLLITVALVALTGVAAAAPLEVEVGAAAVVLDKPHAEHQTIGAGTVSATFRLDPRVPIGLRMHLSLGRDGAGMRVFGIAARQELSGFVLDTGLGIASVTGTESDMAPALRASGIGLVLDLRAGYLVGPVTLNVFARPTWVFASDAIAREGALRSVIEAGVSIGRAL